MGSRKIPETPRESSPAPREHERMPIEELARRTGMTVRNVRALQAKSLLPPPEFVGRKAFYTERHVARVMLVRKLQSRRFSLAAIQTLLETWEAGSGVMDMLGLEDSLMTAGAPVVREQENVEGTFPELLRPRALEKALALEIIVERDGRLVAPNEELLDILKQQVAAGYDVEVVLDEAKELSADLERIAARFRDSFFRHIVAPYMKPEALGSGVADVAEKIAILRPLALRAVTILLWRAIERSGGPPPGFDANLPFPGMPIPGEAEDPANDDVAPDEARRRPNDG